MADANMRRRIIRDMRPLHVRPHFEEANPRGTVTSALV